MGSTSGSQPARLSALAKTSLSWVFSPGQLTAMLRCRKLRQSKLLNLKFSSLYAPVGAIRFEEAKPMYMTNGRAHA